ncbi:response regulator transcription factor [Clostridioides difficile]|nr:response regulator transcription factor [Clostridioides difficile]
MKILVIEDDKDINNMITEYLKEKACNVVQAFSGKTGKSEFYQHTFNLVIVDLMLPEISGEQLIREIRLNSDIPIIVLTAKGSTDSKVQVLDCGADDYLTKPFDLNELWSRIGVQMRHVGKILQFEKLNFREWTLDLTSHIFTVNGKNIELTAHEFGIIELLMKNPQKAYTKQEIFFAVWGEQYYIDDKVINVHISHIRSKLQGTGTENYIQTVWGIGFKLTSKS